MDEIIKNAVKVMEDNARSNDKVYTKGSVYIGDWVDGKMSGKGQMIWSPQKNDEGGLKDDEIGIVKCVDCDVYDGCWSNGRMHGYGVFRFRNGDVYEGSWSNGTRHGYGVYRFASGDVYIGDFKNDCRHGKGKYTWSCGNIYKGDWIAGKMSGKGMTIHSSRTKYDDELKEGFVRKEYMQEKNNRQNMSRRKQVKKKSSRVWNFFNTIKTII